MPTHAEVAKSFWTRSARHWTDQEKLLGLYILSGPHSTSEGYYRLPLGYIVDDLGWETAQVSTTMQRLTDREFVYYDLDAQVVFVVKRLEYRQPRGDKQIRGALNAVRDVPPSSLLRLFLAAAERHAQGFAEALREAFPDTAAQPVEIPLPTPSPRAIPRASGLSPTPSPSPTPNNGTVSPERLDQAKDRLARGAVQRVFDTWIQATGRTSRTELDSKRRGVITRALKIYPEGEVIDAVQGWRHDPHNRGENDRGRPFNDLDLLLRDAAHIERFRDLEQANRRTAGDGFLAGLNARHGLTSAPST